MLSPFGVYDGPMTTTKNTETTVLAHHGIVAAGGQNLADAARDAGLLWACLGCGSVAGAEPGLTTEAYYAASDPGARDLVREWAECCPDADSIVY